MIRTILVPTDGSEHANKAVALAADLAAKYGARLVIFHAALRHTTAPELKALLEGTAIPPALTQKLNELQEAMLDMAASSYEAGMFFIPVPDDVLKQVGSVILQHAQEAAEAKGITDVKTEMADGDPAQTILAAAKREDADMIVMGSRGLGHLAGLLMGSVSHKVTHLADRTCVAVK